MSNRIALYRDIAGRLADVEEIRHIDLWNRNVEFIEQEGSWPMPAVFVEFGDIAWRQVKCGPDNLAWRGSGTVNVHIVTEWAAADDGCPCDHLREGSLHLADIVHGRLEGLCGEGYDSLSLSRTMTNHDHEDVVEDIDVYTVRYTMELQCGPVELMID